MVTFWAGFAAAITLGYLIGFTLTTIRVYQANRRSRDVRNGWYHTWWGFIIAATLNGLAWPYLAIINRNN